jgi:hypothetical protein
MLAARTKTVARLLVAAALAAVACTSEGPMVVLCGEASGGCTCSVEPSASASASSSVTCDPTAFPGTTCCADPGWPSESTFCSCYTQAVYCGIVAGYFTDGSAGCVCSTFERTAGEQPGATCYPGGSTTMASLGLCCVFPNGDCACGAGLHTCGSGVSAVTTCSAANFPAPTHTCTSPQVELSSCSTGSAGMPVDGGGATTDAPSFGACASNADCDPTYQFCQKGACDAAEGQCVTRPGQRDTYYCSPADGGGPVCGCDGQTWSYACLANAEGINVASEGDCPMSDGGAGD